MWVMDMEDQEQLSYFPRALPTNGYRGVYHMWEMRDVLENENYYSVAPSGTFKMTTSQESEILVFFHCQKLKRGPPR